MKKPPAVQAWPPGPGNLRCGVGAAQQQPSPQVRASSKPTAAKRLQDPSTGAGPGAPPPSPNRPHALRSPVPTPPPGVGWGASLIANPPETYRRSERPPANSYQPQPSRKAKKKERETRTSRAGLFGFVCLLVGSIKYSWKVNVPHTGEV